MNRQYCKSGRGMRPVRRSLKLDQVYKVDGGRDKVLRNVSHMRPFAPLLETGWVAVLLGTKKRKSRSKKKKSQELYFSSS